VLAVQWSRPGDPAEVAEVVELPAPSPPGAGEAQLAPEYSPINPADLLRLQGRYGSIAQALPAFGGGEGVAQVVAVGEGVKHVAAGDRVLVPLGRGCWRSALNVPAAALFALPAADPQQLAMLGINAPTAWQLLHGVVPLRAGDWIVQNAAASAVGRMVIQLAHRMGVRTINIVRGPEQVHALRALGADEVFVDGPALAERVAPELREPARLAIDAVAGTATGMLARLLGEGGTVVTYGLLSGEPCAVDARDVVFRDIRHRGFWLARYLTADARASRQVYADLLELVGQGVLRTPVAAVYELADVHAALRHAQQPGRGGKVLLRIGTTADRGS
jgi:mitochondrial enoyl-[acyl-carrier protein] reductase / trans-2-enoyl-CoA reductase